MDGFAHHASRFSFEADRARDFALAAARVQVSRVTWRQVRDEAYALIGRLAYTLARAEVAAGGDRRLPARALAAKGGSGEPAAS